MHNFILNKWDQSGKFLETKWVKNGPYGRMLARMIWSSNFKPKTTMNIWTWTQDDILNIQARLQAKTISIPYLFSTKIKGNEKTIETLIFIYEPEGMRDHFHQFLSTKTQETSNKTCYSTRGALGRRKKWGKACFIWWKIHESRRKTHEHNFTLPTSVKSKQNHHEHIYWRVRCQLSPSTSNK